MAPTGGCQRPKETRENQNRILWPIRMDWGIDFCDVSKRKMKKCSTKVGMHSHLLLAQKRQHVCVSRPLDTLITVTGLTGLMSFRSSRRNAKNSRRRSQKLVLRQAWTCHMVKARAELIPSEIWTETLHGG